MANLSSRCFEIANNDKKQSVPMVDDHGELPWPATSTYG